MNSVPPAALLAIAVLVAIFGILVGGSAGGWIILAAAVAFIAGVERAWKVQR